LTPSFEGNPRTQRHEILSRKTKDLETYAGCPGPYPAISAQFTLKMCVAGGNRKKIYYKPF